MKPRQHLAIVFLVLISFQIGGYYGIMEFLKDRMSEHTAQDIATDQAPIGGQLVLRIPYSDTVAAQNYSNDTHYFTFEGTVYHIIERHAYNETLFVVCIRDYNVTDVQETIESYVQSMAGKNGEQGSTVKFFENNAKYFFTEEYSWGVVSSGWTREMIFGGDEQLYAFIQTGNTFHPPAITRPII